MCLRKRAESSSGGNSALAATRYFSAAPSPAPSCKHCSKSAAAWSEASRAACSFDGNSAARFAATSRAWARSLANGDGAASTSAMPTAFVQ
eukprot:CAMPEP_0176015618 /NCGR_PEP_ID=MMETSP0120_2-20121206/7431_1 /TAXON_ID=160619 /ORGANISM="Kryptoperidinium foliaceum, Strain CCMP 1326" /LENGTH=90 /DNA_ID=CAMNT_0017348595 /DNA_START=77 /DNA_END=346 /DNA_ORIENTATION=-